jgi:RNA polymerase sigma factor (sigma-70 family)
MADTRVGKVLAHVCKHFAAHDLDRVADRCLVQRFAKEGDAAAFEALVRRHGPMVLRVCRQVVRHLDDAEDVFQATFLVLARKASAIRKQESVASWLHGVAYRLAVHSRTTTLRQRRFERTRASIAGTGLPPDVTWQELQQHLHEELARLGDAYRAPLVLCYLESKTQDEAARQLGWSVGTLRRRLDAGRKLLHARLTRRGLSLPAALLAAGLAQDVSAAALTGTLATSTIKAGSAFALGRSPGGGDILPRAATLAERALRRMFLAKLKTTALLVLVLGLAAGGADMLQQQALTANQPDEKQTTAPEPRLPVADTSRPDREQQRRTDLHGDPLPPHALARLGTIRFRHGNQVNGLALSPQGGILATGSEADRSVLLWDVDTGRLLRRFLGPDGNPHKGARALAFTPDGTLLASTCLTDFRIRLWDVRAGKQLREFKADGFGFGHIAISPDSKIVAGAGPRHQIVLWDLASGRILHTIDGSEESTFPPPIAFAPDGHVLASGGQTGTICLWDVATGKEKKRFRQPPAAKQPGSARPGMVQAVAFSPDGRILASTAERTRLWAVVTGEEIRALPGDRYGAFSVAFSPDGKVVSAGEALGMVRTWETSTGKKLAHFQAHGHWISGLVFTPDGRRLISSGDTSIRAWEARTGKEITPDRGHTGGLGDCWLLPDQRALMTTSRDGALRQWDLATGKELRRFTLPRTSTGSPGMALALSPNGKTAVLEKDQSIGENTREVGACLWDLAAANEQAVLWRPNVFSACFSASGKTLFTHSWDVKQSAGFVRSWDVGSGKEIGVVAKYLHGFDGFVLAPDGKTLAAVCRDRETSIRLYATAAGKELRRIAGSPELNQSLAFSPDSKVLAVADGPRPRPDSRVFFHYIHLWDVAAGKELRLFGKTSISYWWAVQFSPDGRTLATAGEDNGIRLWEVATGEERLQLRGHAGRVAKLLFTDRGKKLISASSDTTALVWDVTGLRTRAGAAATDLPQLWSTLADANAAKAYTALWAITATPGHAERFLAQHLRPVEQPDDKAIGQYVRDLESPAFAVRQKAALALSKLDRLAEPALRKALTGQPSVEQRRRIEQLLQQLEAVPTAPRLQTLRAVEALEYLGTPEAQRLLRLLANGAPGARLTREATASLRRLRH